MKSNNQNTGMTDFAAIDFEIANHSGRKYCRTAS